jgi:hypothetical protein
MSRVLRLLIALLVVAAPAAAGAANLVQVESKNVALGATGVQVGVLVTNDFDLTALVLPLEFRSVTAGTFITGSFVFNIPSGNRVGSSPLTGSVTKRTYPTTATPPCTGPVSNTYSASGTVDFISPDAAMWVGVSTSGPPDPWTLTPGSDPPGTANASFNYVFNVTSTPGWIEIDTCCILPANRLSFIDVNAELHTPMFTRGLIKVGNATAPPVVSDIPDQTIDEHQAFAPILLDNYVSDFDDPDSVLTWTATGQSQLIVTIGPGRIATVATPNPHWFGVETITFTARDPGNLTGSDQATFTVRPVNDPPVLAPIGPKSILAGKLLNFAVTATDVDNTSLTLSMAGAPPAATLTSDGLGNGQFLWLTACLDSGVHYVVFIVSDGQLADSENVAITVLPNPDRFQAAPDSLAFSYVIGVTAPPPDTFLLTDPGCGQLAWTATVTQPWLRVDPDTGTTPKPIVVTVDTTGLVGGQYSGKIVITQRTFAKLAPVQIEIPVHLDVETQVCDCPCQGDPMPSCDGIHNIQDVVQIINVVIRGYLDVGYATCPVTVNDVNCDCEVNVVDVVTAIVYIFRGGPPFCDPCVVKPPCPPRVASTP